MAIRMAAPARSPPASRSRTDRSGDCLSVHPAKITSDTSSHVLYASHTIHARTHARARARAHTHAHVRQSKQMSRSDWNLAAGSSCDCSPHALVSRRPTRGKAARFRTCPFSLSLTLQNTWFQIAVQETSIMTGGHGLQEHVAVRGDVLMVQRHVRLSAAVQLHG